MHFFPEIMTYMDLVTLLVQRHRDKISHLIDTMRCIIPPSKRKDMASVLQRAIDFIKYLDEENKVCVSSKQMLDHMLFLI